MWASKVYLRWYKSFNIRFHGYIDPDSLGKSWEQHSEEFFPFIEIPLSRRISTIIGANESGKSHLLSAIEKVLQGWSTNGTMQEEYAIHHVCRYCALDGLEHNVWPHLGIEFSFIDKAEYDKCLSAMGLSPTSQPVHSHERTLKFFANGTDDAKFVAVHDHTDSRIGGKSKEEWLSFCSQSLPGVHFIDSNLALSNEVHIQQLLDMYGESEPGDAYDPLALQQVADVLFEMEITDNAPVPAGTAASLNSLQRELEEQKCGPDKSAKLEMLLFRRILGIDKPTLERIRELGANNRGYVERLVAEINHRLEESLDISQFWQQDDNFTLQVEYKAGFFYFLITDKTGAKYTFNERSSGLRYFLSYYIQAKAITQSMKNRDVIILMDEPDSYLSATAQKNLLQVFEALVDVAPLGNGDNSAMQLPAVQLIYTTHSPFLINRNFPQRIALVRKGDGSEGTQLVERSSARRYEPVRSGLGIDCADTLFMGAMNVVLEGITDQKVIVSSIQAFGDLAKIDDLLDLNKVTFISADGVSNVPRLVERSTVGSEKRPVVIVLVDGDAAGQQVAGELSAKGILDDDFIATLSDVGATPSWCSEPKELEDLIPPGLLAVAVSRYLHVRWKEDIGPGAVSKAIKASDEATTAKKLIEATRSLIGQNANELQAGEIKGGIFDAFVDWLLEPRSDSNDIAKDVRAFEEIIRVVCKKLQEMLAKAETRARRDRLQKNVRLAVERFRKAHRLSATKADTERCLKRINDDCIGSDAHARQARENVTLLQATLDEEVRGASELVKIDIWLKRFGHLWECPWNKNSVFGVVLNSKASQAV